MSEGRKLYKSIQPLKLIVNPIFFVTFYLKPKKFYTSTSCTCLAFSSLCLTLSFKIYLSFGSWDREFEEYLDSYGSFVGMSLVALSYTGYAINGKKAVEALQVVMDQSGFVSEDVHSGEVFKLVVVQVVVSQVLSIGSFLWFYFIYSEDNYQTLIGHAFISYLISNHFTATSLVFADAVLFCRRIIQKVNKKLEKNVWISFVEPVDSLVSLFTTYDSVCGWCENFNDLFGIPLGACCISNLISLILYTYYVTKYGLLELCVAFFGFFNCVLQGWLILYACEKFTKEVRNTGIFVNRLALKTKNINRKEALQQFSMLLLHRKVKFTACGLFALDYRLIYSTLATLAAYLAVVFQFDLASKSSHLNSTKV